MKRKLLSVMLVLIMCMLTLTGCGKKPADAVEKFCKAMKDYDFAAMENCVPESKGYLKDSVENDEELSALRDFMRDQANVIDYKIIDSRVDGEEAVVTVDFTYTDASELIIDVVQEYFFRSLGSLFSGGSEDDFDDMLEEILVEKYENGDIPRTTESIEFSCVKNDGEWVISSVPYEVVNVLTCNIAESLENLGSFLY